MMLRRLDLSLDNSDDINESDKEVAFWYGTHGAWRAFAQAGKNMASFRGMRNMQSLYIRIMWNETRDRSEE
jgi:hypothetical protein